MYTGNRKALNFSGYILHMSPKKVLKYRASYFSSKCLRLKAKVQKLLWSFPTSFLSNQITRCIKGPICEKPDDRHHRWNSTKEACIVLPQGWLWNRSPLVHTNKYLKSTSVNFYFSTHHTGVSNLIFQKIKKLPN